MSLEDQASASQETIWDFDMDAVAKLSTNTPSLTTFPAHAIEGSRRSSPGSVLSSAPSRLLTPSVGSNPGENGYSAETERIIYERRRRIQKSWVYFPENGYEYTTLDGKTRWRCAHCKFIASYLRIKYHLTLALVFHPRSCINQFLSPM